MKDKFVFDLDGIRNIVIIDYKIYCDLQFELFKIRNDNKKLADKIYSIHNYVHACKNLEETFSVSNLEDILDE